MNKEELATEISKCSVCHCNFKNDTIFYKYRNLKSKFICQKTSAVKKKYLYEVFL